MNKEIIGYRKIPSRLIGKNNVDIKKWARKELYGEEPDLKTDVLKAVREGKVKEIFLRPIKKGFFLPDGTFIEALNHSPPIGGDLEKAEEQWDLEEKINKWVDIENKKFNKNIMKNVNHSLIEYWKHGKRIIEFCEKINITSERACKALEVRGGMDEYKVMEHQYCVLFYRWLPKINEDHPIFKFNWKTMAHIAMFGKTDLSICDHVLKQIQRGILENLKSPELALLLQDNLNLYPELIEEDKLKILSFRKKLKSKQELTEEEKNEIKRIIRK